MRAKLFAFALLCVICANVKANIVSLTKSGDVDFRESKQAVEIKLYSEKDGIVNIKIYSPDGFVVKSFDPISIKRLKENVVFWDGMDSNNLQVGNEVYFPAYSFQSTDGEVESYNPITSSGARLFRSIPVSMSSDFNVGFYLNRPARVLVRAGLENGPMLKSITSWQPVNAGSVRFPWDGKASGGEFHFASNRDSKLFATGYSLPDHAIFVSGSKNTYQEYCVGKISDKAVVEAKAQYVMGSQNLSKSALASKCLPSEPVPMLKVAYESDNVALEVDLDERYKKYVQQDTYEISIFIDGKFIAEREQGYLPFFWSSTDMQLAPGEHVLTINLTGFLGFVGTVSKMFSVEGSTSSGR